MAKFTDCLGREWEIRITLGLLPKLRFVGLDVNRVGKDPTVLAGLADPETLGAVLWVLCETKAVEREVSPEHFTDGFDGEVLQSSIEALMGAIADFTQPRKVAAKVKTLIPGAIEKQEAMQMARIEAALGSSGSAGSSPASPASTVPA